MRGRKTDTALALQPFMKTLNSTFLIFACLLLINCKKSSSNKTPETKPVTPPVEVIYHADERAPEDNTTPSLKISWDDDARKISHDIYYAEYGRIHRASDNSLILTYHCGESDNDYWNNIAIRRSTDEGVSWTEVKILMKSWVPGYYGFSNPDILVMKNGWLMMAFEGRGNPDDNIHNNVQMMLSKDNGLTWGQPQIIAQGRSWEPGMIELANGDIELFYSSEAKWWPSSNVQQEILMVHSENQGVNWSGPQTVAYSSGNRDGMPVPLILKDNKGIVFPIESVRDARSPYILWSSVDAKWNYKNYGTSSNSRRWLASADNIFGGAPYMVQLKSGETLASFQASDGRTISDWKKSTMLVYQGNSTAKNFVNTGAIPWPNLPLNEGAYYSSMFMKNDSTVVLVTTRNRADNHSEIWWKEGHISH